MEFFKGLEFFNVWSFFFTLCVNDIGNYSSCDSRLFTNDNCYILQHKNKNGLNTKNNEVMYNVTNWIKVNKLTLNFLKSTTLLINPSGFNTRKVYSSYDTNWSTSFNLPILENARYLNLMFDKNLFFDIHINKLIKKL